MSKKALSKRARVQQAIEISKDPNKPIRQVAGGARGSRNRRRDPNWWQVFARAGNSEGKKAVTNLGDVLIKALWDKDE
jgi:hypothetical protein